MLPSCRSSDELNYQQDEFAERRYRSRVSREYMDVVKTADNRTAHVRVA
jgi:hypothetical protein